MRAGRSAQGTVTSTTRTTKWMAVSSGASSGADKIAIRAAGPADTAGHSEHGEAGVGSEWCSHGVAWSAAVCSLQRQAGAAAAFRQAGHEQHDSLMWAVTEGATAGAALCAWRMAAERGTNWHQHMPGGSSA